MSGGEDRSEQATPQRRKKAKRQGQIGNSPELASWLSLLVATWVIPHVAESMMATASAAIARISDIVADPDPARAMVMSSSLVRQSFTSIWPLGVLAAVIGVASVAAQGSLWFAMDALKPKFSRLNPLKGLKRMFGPHAWFMLGKSLAKTVVLAAVLVAALRQLEPTLAGAGSLQLSSLLTLAVNGALLLLRWAAVAGLGMALLDVAVTRRRNNKQLKMTKHEVKEENKSTEGNQEIRGARRARQLAMRRNRMMADIPTADVVLVNPTHVAVALRYDPAKGAPRVVAKGGDHVAARIREVAEANRVPMVADVPLARTLFKSCAVGDEIPAELYQAVAAVLAFIMTLRKKGSAAGVHTVRPLIRPA